MTSPAGVQTITPHLSQARESVPSARPAVALCALAMVAEGFDTYSVGYAAPIIIREWGSSPTMIGNLFTASVVASAIGTMGIGVIADRFGRKPCLIVALVVFGLATLITAHVANMAELAAVRILSSLALGASGPSAIALACDAVTPSRRAATAALLSASIAIGIVASGLAAAVLVPDHGWQSLMYVGGLFALVLALPILKLVREPVHEATAALGPSHNVGALFAPVYRRATLVLLFVMTTIYATSFFFNVWLPSLLLRHDPDMQKVALANALAQTFSLAGALLTGWAMDRNGLRALAAIFAVTAIVLTAAVGLPSSFVGLVLGCCCICLCINGAFGGALAAPVQVYPQEMRATALGFTIGLARLIGGSLGPLAGGWLLAWNLPTIAVAVAFGPFLLLSAAALFLYARRA